MTTQILTCPYCNASLSPQPGLAAGQRIVCPRCGDAFALRSGDAFTHQPPPSRPAETAITSSVSPIRPRWPNRLIAGAVLGVMLLMAGVGLTFMLMTQGERRAHDTSRPPRRPGRQPVAIEPEVPAVAPVVTVPPDKLAALGYLPSGVNFLLAARIPELAASPSGMRLLRDPIKFGESEYRLDKLPSWVGLRLEDIDHLVFAARVEDALIPPFYLVLRTTQAYDGEQIRERLKAVRVAGAGKKQLYSFRKGQNGITLHAWFADERTVIVALFLDQLEALPAQPAEDLRQLPEEVRNILKQRREPVAPIWVVGHSRDWTKTTAGKFLSGAKKDDFRRLATLRTFGIGLVPGDTLGVKGAFECKDDAAARALDDYFRSLRGQDSTYKSILDGPWLTLQLQTGPDFLSRVLKR